METTTSGHLPNVIIIGAMKAGTTSLHHYLNLHPDIQMSRQKELNFFSENKHWKKGVEWYRSHFVGEAAIHGESSPNYTRYPFRQATAQRMAAVVPNVKLIYLVRHPIERIISHYLHKYAEGKENKSINEALASLDENMYVSGSQYFTQLEQYLQFFPPDNILVVASEALSQFPQDTMMRVFQFLGVSTEFVSKAKLKGVNDFLIFGPAVAQSSFKFDQKLHQSVYKSRRRLPEDSWVLEAITKVTALMPVEIRHHAEKVLYLPFSQRVERPTLDDDTRSRILNYLAEDISRLKDYAKQDFAEWQL
ncbi:MAG: sulfotransferase [Cyanobacteria bacterium P01_D01_bin.1]